MTNDPQVTHEAKESDVSLTPPAPIFGNIAFSPLPFHTNPTITAEVVAPLLRQQLKEFEKQVDSVLRGHLLSYVIGVRGPSEEIDSETKRSQRDTLRLHYLDLVTQFEKIRDDFLVHASTCSPQELLQGWFTLAAPLLERLSDFSASGERRVTDKFSTVKTSVLDIIKEDRETEVSLTALASLLGGGADDPSAALGKYAEVAIDGNKRVGRIDRAKLAVLRYDPRAQTECCSLNDIAIAMYLERIDAHMDPNQPTIAVPDDDLRLLSMHVANILQHWAGNRYSRMFQELIEESDSFLVDDSRPLLEKCDAISEAMELSFSVHGADKLEFAISFSNCGTFSEKNIRGELNDLLITALPFEQALGVSHQVSVARKGESVVVKVELILPTVDSALEPHRFQVSENLLERLSLEGMSDKLQALAEEGSEDPQVEIVAHVERRASIFPFSYNPKVTIIATRDFIEGVDEDIARQNISIAGRFVALLPDVESVSISMPHGFEALGSSPMSANPVIRIFGTSPKSNSPYDLVRERIESNRTTSTRSAQGIVQLIMPAESSEMLLLSGAHLVEEYAGIIERISDLPKSVTLAGMRMRLFTGTDQSYLPFREALEKIAAEHSDGRIFLSEKHGARIGTKDSRLKLMVFSDSYLPIAEMRLARNGDPCEVVSFPIDLFIEIRDRLVSAMNAEPVLEPRRYRDLDRVLVSRGIDVSDTILNQLLVVSNSWQDRPITPERISWLLREYLLSNEHTLKSERGVISLLRFSETGSAGSLV